MSEQQDHKTQVVYMLMAHELALSLLYEAYARKFPDFGLWSELAKAEKKHAGWILGLIGKIEDGSAYFGKRRFRVQAVQGAIDYLDDERTKASRQSVSLLQALSIAVSVEGSLLEKKFLESFDTDSAVVRRVLDELTDDTKCHLQTVKQAWTQCREHQ
jgi:hypothetical protein